MNAFKLALLGGAALAVTSVAAHADDLDTLKAQIETLNARVAAMETAPAVPAGYQLIAVSEGALEQTPGLPMDAHQLAGYGDKSTIISVLPTADAPAGTTISWSGYARAGLVYTNKKVSDEITVRGIENVGGTPVPFAEKFDGSYDTDDTDVRARGQLRVKASTDTAVGEVGVDIRLRGNFDGNGQSEVYSDVAWGYWSMTPEMTFGGGYAGSLGNIGYGLDGACSCYYTDNADVDFNPGDVTQMRLSYGSGPFSMAIALEDASINSSRSGDGSNSQTHGDKLGAAAEIKYSGDSFSGEISGVWRDRDDNGNSGITDLWQVGAGIGFSLGDMASLSLAAALGEGPFQTVGSNSSDEAGDITTSLPYNQSWWGVSALASANLSDSVSAEIAAGYKNRQGDDFKTYNNGNFGSYNGADYDTWSILGGLYYQPVDQLTIGVEAEYYTVSASVDGTVVNEDAIAKVTQDIQSDNFTVDLVSVWRF